MEESMSTFCKTLAHFCNHLQTNCDALKQSVERRPVPLGAATSNFIQNLKGRVTSADEDLELLDKMSFGTISFEELLGHCNEVYKKNQSDIAELEDRLTTFGYVPEIDVIEEDKEVDVLSLPMGFDSKLGHTEEGFNPPSPSAIFGASSAADSIMKRLKEDSLYDDTLSLRNLGLSDASLATLASDAYEKSGKEDRYLQEPIKTHESVSYISGTFDGEPDQNSPDIAKSLINVSKDDYEIIPSYMKSLTSWEELLAAVEKMNSSLSNKVKTSGTKFFRQDELECIGLGSKCRSFLLLLVRMNRLVVEIIDGSISYRVVS